MIENRTPDEIEALTKFYSEARYKYQVQVWHAGELKGTFLDINKAIHCAGHIWTDQGYKETRVSYLSELCANVEIKSLVDERWMTSNTFLRHVKVGEDDTLGMMLAGIRDSEMSA
jgi:hypothetical protein